VSFVNRKNIIGCIILKSVNFLDWKSCVIGFMSWSSHCSYENSSNGDILTLLWIYTIRCIHVSIYIEVNLFFRNSIVSLRAICLVPYRQRYFFSVILMEILNNYVNNHTRKDQFVPVYSMTACCIPAFIRNLRTTLRWLISLQRPPFYSREKNSRFSMNGKFDGYQGRSGGFGEMSGIMIIAPFR
jgi:hypothetical protein